MQSLIPEAPIPEALIPEARRDAVTDALRAVFGAAPVEELEVLKGGLSSAMIYRLRVGGRDHALRVVMQPGPAPHFAAMANAAEAGIAPRVLYADPASAITITDFVERKPLALYAGSREALLAELAGLVRALQQTAPLPAMSGHLDVAEGLIADFTATGFLSPQATGEHLFRFSQMREVWPADAAVAPAHNDLNPGNILYDGARLWLIDWEVAAGADPFGDPACLAASFRADETQEALLMETWLGRAPTEIETARFHLMRQVWPMVQAMMILKGVAQERPDLASPLPFLMARDLGQVYADLGAGRLDISAPETRLEFGKALLDDMLPALRGPRFAKALRVLA